MIEVTGGIPPHPDAPHYPLRPGIANVRERHNFLQPDLIEAEGDRRSGSLGRVAISPELAGEPPADLDRRCEGRLEHGFVETHEPDERSGATYLDGPQAEAAPLEFLLSIRAMKSAVSSRVRTP